MYRPEEQSGESMGQALSGQSNEQGQQEEKITVYCQEKVKSIKVDRRSFKKLRETVGTRFGLKGDFQLQFKQEEGERRDIDVDEDLLDNYEFTHTLWVLLPPQEQQNENQIVRLADMDYSVSAAPDSQSPVVKKAIVELNSYLGDIRTVHKTIDLVGDSLRLAYYCVLVDRKDLQPKIENIQFDVLNLCQSMDVAIIGCKLTAGDILNDLMCSFDYLMDDLNEYALQKFAAIGKKSGTMKDRFTNMIDNFEKMVQEINEVTASINTKKISGHEKYLNEKLEDLKTNVASSSNRCNELQKTIKTSQQEKKQTLENDAGTFKPVAWLFKGCGDVVEHHNSVIETARADHTNELERLEKLKKEEEAAHNTLLEFSSPKVDEMAESALHAAGTALKTLRCSMLVLKKYLASIQQQCNSINGPEFKINEGKQSWQTMGFKREALNFSSRWVALMTIFEDFHSGFVDIEGNLHCSILDNPTVDEAREKIDSMQKELKTKKAKEIDT